MKLFKTVNSQGTESYFNINYLISLEPILTGTKITIKGAMTTAYYDYRQTKEIAAFITNLSKSKTLKNEYTGD